MSQGVFLGEREGCPLATGLGHTGLVRPVLAKASSGG